MTTPSNEGNGMNIATLEALDALFREPANLEPEGEMKGCLNARRHILSMSSLRAIVMLYPSRYSIAYRRNKRGSEVRTWPYVK